jgi:cellobiose phosphorylase
MSAPPAIALLANGSYATMVTDAGGGYSTWRDLDVTRWREDATRDCWGPFCYLRDRDRVWSAAAQPLPAAGRAECEFHPGRAEFRRRDGDIETRLVIVVAPDADAELRVITLVNHGDRRHEIELTSYAEVCLGNRRADQAHPAFAKLFLETEFDTGYGALLARRRPRGAKEKPVWAVHAATPKAGDRQEYETDRARFLGRGRTPANPTAMEAGTKLSGTTGPVLDPIFSLRRRVVLDPGASARVAFVTGAADTREAALAIAERFGTLAAIANALAAAGERSENDLRALGLAPDDVVRFNRLAAAVAFACPEYRDLEAVAANRLGQSALWPHAISGDLPIVFVRLTPGTDSAIVQQLIHWRIWARRHGLTCDLVILDGRGDEQLARLRTELATGPAGDSLGKPGGVFCLAADKVSPADATLMAAAARVVLDGGKLGDQFDRRVAPREGPQPFVAPESAASEATVTSPPEDLRFWNGTGGFSPDGREYVIVVDGAALPPAPWTNVLANPQFGCLVTEAGLGYSWAGNSQMNRLTPWSNDPTSDLPGEVVYLRDDESGAVWTPTPLPLGRAASVTVRHGQGYTQYAQISHGLRQDLVVFVPMDEPVKVLRLTVRNDGDRPRRLSVAYYAEWVLGTVRENAPLQVVSERDSETGALLARNAWAGSFAENVAFAAASPPPASATADRSEFLGVMGSTASPAGLQHPALSGRVGPGLDPCAAMTTTLSLAPGESGVVVFVLGQAADLSQARRLVRTYAQPERAAVALAEVQQHWDRCLGALQVTTPDPAIDLMLNRWLVYQVLACRLWARSAFYQSGGAYGFRDQLQDVMALVYSAPSEARAQILRAAGRQFEEGDVQHWWHPPSGIGVRTRITDDLYFLPLVVHHYVTTTGDSGLLEEAVPFIASPVLRAEQEEDFGQPATSKQAGTVYEHCLRALRHGYQLGAHGLPLMGTGDWNDGMNKVGAHGKGESVWNGWFFVSVLRGFAELAERHGKADDASWCRQHAEELRSALEANAWDGAWYRRAYFDDGTPLGSGENDECQIDAIPQAWAVISGAADPVHARAAMDAVQDRLVRNDDRLIKLFDPPFDKGKLEPGYIKGYVPGIRENGGQYTHAATWVALATALQGQGERALDLWNLINPVTHATTPEAVEHYKVEPYVVCADVYGAPPHTGRGGWTWYTGSASWLYRVAIEAILGFHLHGDELSFAPCIPPRWPGFELNYRHRSATYRVVVDNAAGTGSGVKTVEMDGARMPAGIVPLSDDARTHTVRVQLG